MKTEKRRGRPPVGKGRDFRIPEENYRHFQRSCREKGKNPSKNLRKLIDYHLVKEFIEEDKGDFARRLLKEEILRR